MSEARTEAKAGEKPNLNTCCDAVQSKIDQALLKLSGLEQTLKTTSPQPHQEKVYGAVRGVLTAISAVDEATMLFEGMPEKEQPEVPCKLLEWLDAGKDPDTFYKHLIDDTIWGSQVCSMLLQNARFRYAQLRKVQQLRLLVLIVSFPCAGHARKNVGYVSRPHAIDTGAERDHGTSSASSMRLFALVPQAIHCNIVEGSTCVSEAPMLLIVSSPGAWCAITSRIALATSSRSVAVNCRCCSCISLMTLSTVSCTKSYGNVKTCTQHNGEVRMHSCCQACLRRECIFYPCA